ncbi:hypothetical protein L248_1155 [Schleiferilactobacillus shenzhenensis LY-73]|uniref:Uncharacterized protein n=1 Tax=Schleiferilactobacillus shenzhenensis LY-73 TaxID=1231336 RepID=U4TW46_9LACO|nr:hypothetical protein L248_1155 [Schleiferilactobacillus shenzhenensis LY-73]
MLLGFISAAIVILRRTTDGTGHVETGASRLVALAVLGIALLLILAVELIVWLVKRRHE